MWHIKSNTFFLNFSNMLVLFPNSQLWFRFKILHCEYTFLIYSLSILFPEWHWPDAPCPVPLPLSLSYLQSPEVWEAWEGQLHHPSTTSHSPDGLGVATRCVFRFTDISGISQFKQSGKTQSGVSQKGVKERILTFIPNLTPIAFTKMRDLNYL